ncbi:hypothetical protein H5410_003625 [Solanum commersonii]|uniref:Uncharacterized protein n=1 Tax=Solanum commersonii TaxID=4109 RepID=A0A9J6B5P0_SOLCO|nr:hypothetical protein H5410_003625 [Solanum commersonii]
MKKPWLVVGDFNTIRMDKGQGASHTWRKLITTREEIEHSIWWQVKVGNSSFWFDNWTKLAVACGEYKCKGRRIRGQKFHLSRKLG